MSERPRRLDELRPYIRPLTTADVETCTILEAEAFPPAERASKEKIHYRLAQAPISYGLFAAPADAAAEPTLIAHVVSTLSDSERVTDGSMETPSTEHPDHGHHAHGRTLCIHSLAVLPTYQGIGAGSHLLREYLREMERLRLADRAAIIAHEGLMPYYERFGFVSLGESQAQFGGGGWWDMVKVFGA